MRSPVRLGVIGSSGGGALISACACLKSAGKNIEWVVVTDRECGLDAWAKIKATSSHRIEYRDANAFSEEANKIFKDAGCEDVLLFYTRRVSAPLINQKRVSNIHPALLPAFRGLNGVKDALSAGVKVIGATLHHVDAGLDTGKIVAQVSAPLSHKMTLMEAEHLSYLQKIWLTLVWFDRLILPHVFVDMGAIGRAVVAASPGIADDKLRASYIDFIKSNE
jgi:phosphoribosylglycinamide formyltransferase-1